MFITLLCPNFLGMRNNIARLYFIGLFIAISVLSINFLMILPSSAQQSPPAYTNVTQALVTPPLLADNTTIYEVTTNGPIPQVQDNYINSTLGFGYAWFDSSSPTNAVIEMSHQPGLDSYANPNAWHSHVATLNSTSACSGVGNELEIISLTSATNVIFEIVDNTLRMAVTDGTVTNQSFDSTMSFQILQAGGALCLGSP